MPVCRNVDSGPMSGPRRHRNAWNSTMPESRQCLTFIVARIPEPRHKTRTSALPKAWFSPSPGCLDGECLNVDLTKARLSQWDSKARLKSKASEMCDSTDRATRARVMEFDSNMRLSEQPKIAMGATRNHDPMGTTPRIELIDATRRDSTGAHWMMPDTAKYTTESVRLDGCDPVSVTRSVGFEKRDCSQNATESVQLDGCNSMGAAPNLRVR